MATGYLRYVLALLRQPRWVGLAAVTVVMCVLFWWLGTWQWGRHVERSARNDAIEAAASDDPAPLTSVVPDPEQPVSDGAVYRRVTATGTYLADGAGSAAKPPRPFRLRRRHPALLVERGNPAGRPRAGSPRPRPTPMLRRRT